MTTVLAALAPVALEASLVAAILLLLARPRSAPPFRSWLLRLGLLKFALPPLLAWPVLPQVGVAFRPATGASPLAAMVAAVVLAGALVVLLRTVRERWALGTLLRGARPWDGAAAHAREAWLMARLARLAADAGLARPPRVLVSTAIAAPMVAGWPRPALVLPAVWAATAPAGEVDLVLSHELAHLKRGDLAWLELSSWLAAAWWWNPLFRLVVARARAAAEDACDDAALAGSRASVAEYGAVLVRVAETAAGRPPVFAAALGVHATERRLRRLLDATRRSATRLSMLQRLALAALALALLPGLAPRPTAGSPSHVHVLHDSGAGLHHHHHHGR